jgi:hypothetical protein
MNKWHAIAIGFAAQVAAVSMLPSVSDAKSALGFGFAGAIVAGAYGHAQGAKREPRRSTDEPTP